MFERGGVYRTESAIIAKSGVSYGSFGNGAKPAIYGSARNYARGGLFVPDYHRVENLWKLNLPTRNTGIIVFNHGEAVGRKTFNGIEDLKQNGDFYHNTEHRTLFMYMDTGNPQDVYKDIEIGTNDDIFTVPKNTQNVVFDNLCLKYTGSFCINIRQNIKGIVVKNCEMGWVGGSTFTPRRPKTRYGNAVQFWESTYDALVENNWIYQCYDTAITPQGDLLCERI